MSSSANIFNENRNSITNWLFDETLSNKNFNLNTGCGRNSSHILNWHLSDANELEQGVMVAPFFFFLAWSIPIIAWTGAHSKLACKLFFWTGKSLIASESFSSPFFFFFCVLFSCYIGIILLRIETATGWKVYPDSIIIKHEMSIKK